MKPPDYNWTDTDEASELKDISEEKAYGMQDRKKDTDVYNGLLDSEGEGEGGMIWENGILNMYTIM